MIPRIKKAIKVLINHKTKRVFSPNDLIQYQRVQPWFAVKGDETLRLDYDLNYNSIVFDVGGYKGVFAAEILCKYNSTIYVFEPIKEFYSIINSKFINNEKVKRFNFGLAGKYQEMQISLSDNSSSIYLKAENCETIQLKSIVEFIQSNNITQIDLIKINIEGGEYELLESLIENNYLKYFKNIQVQFHDFIIDNAKERMNKIQNELAKTHELTYQFEFVWENWKLK
jgi:FkbM family methyltransferase